MKLLFLLLLSLYVITGCGPSLKLGQNYDKEKPNQLVAVLPVVAETEVPSEQLENLRQSLVSALRNSDYLVLSHELVTEHCPNSPCKNLDNLLEAHDLSGAFELSVDSYGHTGFIIGFYSTVGGNLKFVGPGNSNLFQIEHRESKRGGLLFNSGQLITAIKNQIDSGTNEKKEELQSKFVRALISEVPEITRSDTRFSPPKIKNTQIINLTDLNRTRFCVDADSSLASHILVGELKADLRPKDGKRHCAVYSNELFEECNVKFIVATKFGDASVKTVKREDCDA